VPFNHETAKKHLNGLLRSIIRIDEASSEEDPKELLKELGKLEYNLKRFKSWADLWENRFKKESKKNKEEPDYKYD
jgi:hypothetical protein